MKLINSTLRPGRVLEVLENGYIKVEAPGLFSREDSENLPSVMPFGQWHANSYSAPKEGDEVWILSQSDNPQDLKWIRKDTLPDMDSDLMSDEECEILVNRETANGVIAIYYTSADGIVITNNDSTINIKEDGSILINANLPHRVIDINSGGISIGSEGSSDHPAAYGDEVETHANQVYNALNAIMQAASGNIYTQPIGAALRPILPLIKNQIPNITSNNVSLD